jgi:hypothetical protein
MTDSPNGAQPTALVGCAPLSPKKDLPLVLLARTAPVLFGEFKNCRKPDSRT